jgi:hypothetical protein
MYWECACGITNHVNSPVCAGCGWTKIKADKYKGGQFTKDDIENENRMMLEAQRDEKIFIKDFWFYVLGYLLPLLLLDYIFDR